MVHTSVSRQGCQDVGRREISWSIHQSLKQDCQDVVRRETDGPDYSPQGRLHRLCPKGRGY